MARNIPLLLLLVLLELLLMILMDLVLVGMLEHLWWGCPSSWW